LRYPHIILVQNASEMQSLWVQTRPLGSAIGLEMRRDLLLPHNLFIKRILDLAIALPLAMIALPFVAALALAVSLVDPGWPIYRQLRVGRHGKPIQVLKLRTMYSDADTRLLDVLQSNPAAAMEWEKYLKLSNDPRILPVVGQFLRRTSLDELPQLWNILRGNMSLVGPRPFPSYHTERFDSEFQELRTSVTPGLTGLWQVSSRSNGDLAIQKAEDSFYIMNWSIWFDLYVLLQTAPAVITAKGAK
jgi:lipopolysaccharide/colanic/teichoic acid biosynthesis glycosyltransferase